MFDNENNLGIRYLLHLESKGVLDKGMTKAIIDLINSKKEKLIPEETKMPKSTTTPINFFLQETVHEDNFLRIYSRFHLQIFDKDNKLQLPEDGEAKRRYLESLTTHAKIEQNGYNETTKLTKDGSMELCFRSYHKPDGGGERLHFIQVQEAIVEAINERLKKDCIFETVNTTRFTI